MDNTNDEKERKEYQQYKNQTEFDRINDDKKDE